MSTVDTRSLKMSGSGAGNAKTRAVVKHITNGSAAAVQQEFAKKILTKKMRAAKKMERVAPPGSDPQKKPHSGSVAAKQQAASDGDNLPFPELKPNASIEEEKKFLEAACKHPDVLSQAKVQLASIRRPRKRIKKGEYHSIGTVNDQGGRVANIVEGETLPDPESFPDPVKDFVKGFVWVKYDSEPKYAYMEPRSKFTGQGRKPARSTRNKIDRFGPGCAQQPKNPPQCLLEKHVLIPDLDHIQASSFTAISSTQKPCKIRYFPRPDAPDFEYQLGDFRQRTWWVHNEFIREAEKSGMIPDYVLVDAFDRYPGKGKGPGKFIRLSVGDRLATGTKTITSGPINPYIQPKGSHICLVASTCCLLKTRGLGDLAEEIFKIGCTIRRDSEQLEKFTAFVHGLVQPFGFCFRRLEKDEFFDPLDPEHPKNVAVVCEALQTNKQWSGHAFAILNNFIHDPVEDKGMDVSTESLNATCTSADYKGMRWQVSLEFGSAVVEGAQSKSTSNCFNLASSVFAQFGANIECDELLACSRIFAAIGSTVSIEDASSLRFLSEARSVLKKFGLCLEPTKKNGGPFYSPLENGHEFSMPVFGRPFSMNPNHVMPFVFIFKDKVYDGSGGKPTILSKQSLDALCAPNLYHCMDFSYCVIPDPEHNKDEDMVVEDEDGSDKAIFMGNHGGVSNEVEDDRHDTSDKEVQEQQVGDPEPSKEEVEDNRQDTSDLEVQEQQVGGPEPSRKRTRRGKRAKKADWKKKKLLAEQTQTTPK